jgi:hypothetical protein
VTARRGNLELLEYLLNIHNIDVTVKDKEDRTILHWWARASEKNPDDNERLKSCFKLIVNKVSLKKRSFTDEDTSGNTPFSIAVDREYRDRVMLMLNTVHGKPKFAHIKQVLDLANKSLLQEILDNCFESNDEPTNSDCLKVDLNLGTIINMTNFAEVSHYHKDILKHPIMSIYINLKWEKMKYFSILNLIFYVTFLLFLTAHILFSEYCNTQNNRDVGNNSNSLLSHNDSDVKCGLSDEGRHITSQVLWYVLMVLLGMLCVREGSQLIAHCKDYIYEKENWLDLLLIGFTFTLCSGIVDNIEAITHLSAIANLLGWFELLLMLGRLPLFSVQTEMFKKVSWTFVRFMAGYIVLILAFAFSFYIIFKEDVEVDDAVRFTNPFISVLQTIVMFAGEFEPSGLRFDRSPVTSHLIFLSFVFFVAIVLLNLLQGLAVGDTSKVREEAETLSLVARLKLIKYILGLNEAVSNFIKLPKFIKKYFTLNYNLSPNKEKSIKSTDLRTLKRIITEKRERNKKEKTTEHVENWKLFEEKLSKLQLQSEKMHHKLSMLQLQSEKMHHKLSTMQL